MFLRVIDSKEMDETNSGQMKDSTHRRIRVTGSQHNSETSPSLTTWKQVLGIAPSPPGGGGGWISMCFLTN